METSAIPSSAGSNHHQRLQQYLQAMISEKREACLARKNNRRTLCTTDCPKMKWEAMLLLAGALGLAIAAAQFGFASYQPAVFALGWLFFRSLQGGVNRLLYLKRLHQGIQVAPQQGFALGQHPTFRLCLIIALLVAFSLSIIFHRGFFFGAGMVWGWMLQSYFRQIRQLGLHLKMVMALQAFFQI